VPPSGSAGTGSGQVVLNAGQTQITVDLSWTGLGSNATAASIYLGSPGVNGPIVFP
jgi:hypothetical protein